MFWGSVQVALCRGGAGTLLGRRLTANRFQMGTGAVKKTEMRGRIQCVTLGRQGSLWEGPSFKKMLLTALLNVTYNNPFKVYILMIWGSSIESCKHHHSAVLDRFHHPQKFAGGLC